MSKSKKSFRPKARVPRGLRDQSGAQLQAERWMLDTIAGVYARYGFELLDTPAFEYADALGKFLPDQDRPNEGVFSFQDDDEQWLSMRYDLTAPLARYVAENYDSLPKPFRRYQWGPVWRNEKPGPGRFRQFIQIDADSVGAPGMAADAEMIAMMADCMDALGIARGDYVVRINNRKILDGILETDAEISPTDPASEEKWLTAMRALDKHDRFGWEGVEKLLGEGRKDESGDYTKGAGLSRENIDNVRTSLSAAFTVSGAPSSPSAQPSGQLSKYVPGDIDKLVDRLGRSTIGLQGLSELEEIAACLAALGIGSDQVVFDPYVVRGLGYYTGPVFEVELTFEAENEQGEMARFGSVGSGGRYDGLVEMFKGVEVPATGCSFGVSRLMAALEALGKTQTDEGQSPVVVLVMDKERIADYLVMVKELRDSGICAEMYMGGSGMRAQMKYADKRRAPLVVIEGEDERAVAQVTLKDLILGEQLSNEISDNEEWRSGAQAQVSVPRAGLVEGVRNMLIRIDGRQG